MRVIDTGRDGFRARLAESIARLGLSQSDVARRVGVERSAVNAWVRGRRTPDLETTRKLAAMFAWPIPEMLAWFGIYEPMKPQVNVAPEQIQPVDNRSILSGSEMALTVPVTPSGQPTHGPQKELIEVPTPEHRALFAVLAALSPIELEPIAHSASRIWLRHFGGTKQSKAEGE